MRIVYLGSGEFGIECLNALAGSGHELNFIVSQPPHPAGRGRKPRPTSVICWAQNHSIPFIETENLNSPPIIEKIAAYAPEIILVIAFGQKIGNDLIALPTKKAINVHASLLPKYRGAAPINWAIINGDKQTGISIITLAQKMDAGDIIAQARTDINPDETAGLLHDRLAKLAAPLLIKSLKEFEENSVTYAPQDPCKVTLAPKLKKSDGFLDFNQPAALIRKKILGFWPWPGAAAIYQSKKTTKQERVTIAMAVEVETENPQRLPPGTLDENLNVICAQNALKFTKIIPAGHKLMDFKDFANGRATNTGDFFLKIND